MIQDTPEQLAALHAALLDTLDHSTSGEDALNRLRAHPASAPYRAWIDSLEPRALDVAVELVATWGRRAPVRARD